MKSLTIVFTVMATSLLLVSTRAAGQATNVPDDSEAAAPDTAVSNTWPVVVTSGGNTYTIFEPQCDSWDGHALSARSAVAVRGASDTQPTYGVINFTAITLVDKTTRTAKLAQVKVTGADFPSAPSADSVHLAVLQQQLPQLTTAVSLDRLEAGMTLAVTQPKPGPLNNTPPEIIVATRPATLVYIDGPPALRPVAGTSLQRVINTRSLLLKDAAGQYYLHVFDGYLQAPALAGPWKPATQPPAGADTAEKLATDAGQVDLLQGQADAATGKMPTLASSPTPDIYVATKPAELLSFTGEPTYASIPGTDLLYAENTSANVFMSLTDQQQYILLSGRWYRAASVKGPWQFVPGDQLPKDFANIPESSPKENVKASVPGTPQAEEALIANSIPQSTAVPRTTEMASPQVDGAPQLAGIDGTPLHYVVNSATPIIEVNPQSWYACQDGVWYAAASAGGPWSVATAVPQVIYTIPTTSPLHYLTYVQVYGSSPTEVYEGYTPGYYGTEVSPDDTVVYGTGYYYQPWVGSVWYGPPITWGCGFAPCWAPWYGWGFGCGFGWGWGVGGFAWGCFPPRPWWGGFHGWYDHGFRHGFDHGFHRDGFARGGFANTGHNLYQRGGFNGADSRGHFAANGFTGRGNFGHAYNSRTGDLAAGEHAQVRSVTGSAWHPASSGFAANRGFNGGALGGARTFSPRVGSFSSGRSWTVPTAGGYTFRGNVPSGQSFARMQPGFGGVNRGYGGSFGGYRGGIPSPGYGGYSHASIGSPYAGGFRGYSGGNFGTYGGGFRGGGFNGGGAFHGGGMGSFGGGGGFHGGGGFGGGGGFHGGGGGGHR